MTSHPDSRPNVIVILSDDQGYWAVQGPENDEIVTPNLNRLAASGTTLENFFCASPVCSPARATLLTGSIPSCHGIHDWIRSGNWNPSRERSYRRARYLDGQIGYPDILSRNGYVCGISGKWHLGDSAYPQNGFSFWEVHAEGGGPYYNAPMFRESTFYREAGYLTDAITDNAIRFIAGQKENPHPFYLSINYTAPHSPWGRDQHPHRTYDHYFNNCPFNSIARSNLHRDHINTAEFAFDEESRRAVLSGYFAAVTEMDRNIGRIIEYLDDRNILGQTLIVFTSDNGMNMGHHGIYGKGNGTYPQNMYDTSIRVPAIFSWPDRIQSCVSHPDLLSQYDFMPSLMELLEITDHTAGEKPGRSFAPLLENGRHGERESIAVYDEYGAVRMIRTNEWKYVHRYRLGCNQLFNLIEDPDEERNLATIPKFGKIMKELRILMEDWFLEYSDPEMDGRKERVTGRGQLAAIGSQATDDARFADDWKYLSSISPSFPISL